MKKHKISSMLRTILFVASFLVASKLSIKADDISWSWSYTGANYNGAGTFTTESTLTTENGFSGYLITSISGSANGEPILSLDMTGGVGTNDNLLAPSEPQLDGNGVSFFTQNADGPQYAPLGNNIYFSSGINSSYRAYNTGQNNNDPSGVFLASEVPEPTVYAMMLFSLGAVVICVRCKLA